MPVTCDIRLYAGTLIGVIHLELPPGLENDPEGLRQRMALGMQAFRAAFETPAHPESPPP